jgi:NAD(P)-dependent dehydrogenase (short-subunit alcohol dehydrogenase family)
MPTASLINGALESRLDALTLDVCVAFVMVCQSGRGHIIVINSVQGKVGLPARTSYSASKHALTGYAH